MKVTVCQMRNTPELFAKDWQALARHVREQGSELVLLPEMPFYPWPCASPEADPAVWQSSMTAHGEWFARLPELGAETVAYTRPVMVDNEPRNQACIWWARQGETQVRQKHYLPDETGWYEATWYRPGPKEFQVTETEAGKAGFLICTEIWFGEHAREYCRQEADLLLSPRATGVSSGDVWLAAGRTAAMVAGAYGLSSNFAPGGGDAMDWGGMGWIIEPEGGDVLGLTTSEEPFLTLEIDLKVPARAKETYPRYVEG